MLPHIPFFLWRENLKPILSAIFWYFSFKTGFLCAASNSEIYLTLPVECWC